MTPDDAAARAVGPITATVLGAWWLGERPGPGPLVGLVVAVAGIVVAHREGRRRGPAAT